MGQYPVEVVAAPGEIDRIRQAREGPFDEGTVVCRHLPEILLGLPVELHGEDVVEPVYDDAGQYVLVSFVKTGPFEFRDQMVHGLGPQGIVGRPVLMGVPVLNERIFAESPVIIEGLPHADGLSAEGKHQRIDRGRFKGAVRQLHAVVQPQ